MITVKALNKNFRVSKRNKGLIPTVKAFFHPDFQIVHALTDVSFHISPGEIVGYIGPNGAGKSTTIKIMSGVLVPDSGECTISGRTPWKERIEHVKDIGVVFGQRSQLWWDVPVIDSFHLLKDIYNIPKASFDEMSSLLTETLDIKEILTTPVRQLSLGQRMRAEIAASLLHNPKILFLDEPTIGLDAVSKIAVRNFIKELNREKNTTVILTTHDMSDIEALASRLLLIGKGTLLMDGNLDELKTKNISHKKLTIDHGDFYGILSLPNVQILSQSPNRTVLDVDIKKQSISSIIAKISNSIDIYDLSVEAPPIEELIVDLYKAYSL